MFEASRKKQCLVLQPRGKPLYEDDSSFGSKLLAKMGWKKGNGLGKEQHGNVDFIQIKYKNDAVGLGFDKLKDNQWTSHEGNFNNLLKSLHNSNTNSANNSNTNSGAEEDIVESLKNRKSLEEKSKNSRARVHYHKFTRGKDLSRYSEKDLANIFGKKSLVELSEKAPVEEPEKDEKNDEEKNDVYESNLIINTGVSVKDYFKEKMKRFQKQTEDNEVEENQNEATEEIAEEPKTSKKKKSKKEKTHQAEEADVAVDQNQDEVKPKKKKSKKRKLEESEPEIVEIVEEVPKTKKKKKVEIVPEVSDDLVQTEPKTSKSKKSEKQEEAVVVIEDSPEKPKEKKKKNKKQKVKEPETDIENPSVEIVDLIEDSADLESSKSNKSKKKSKKREIENEEKSAEKSKKKKKLKAECSVETASPSKSQNTNTTEQSINSSDNPGFLSGKNVLYQSNVIQINSAVAEKLANLNIDKFEDANIANIVGYGLTENVELKAVKTKMVEDLGKLDKYALYNVYNPEEKHMSRKKLFSKLKRPKNSFQVL